MTQFSFPTVELQGIGPCVTRRVLMDRAGITSGQLTQFQNALVPDQDYFYMPNPGAGMACNFYRVSVIQRLAQAFPTAQAQQMAQEVTAFMGAQFASPAALPPSSAPYAQLTTVEPVLCSVPATIRSTLPGTASSRVSGAIHPSLCPDATVTRHRAIAPYSVQRPTGIRAGERDRPPGRRSDGPASPARHQ